MSEETKLLLEPEEASGTSSSGNHGVDERTHLLRRSSDDYAYEISAKELRAWKNNYGALRGNEELIPVKKQITFSWCEINAYGQEPPDPNQNRVVSLIKKQEVGMKHILKNVSGVAHPGELLVLMGSSGAGKTTLMNCMTFRNLKSLTISGLVCINDQPVSQTQLAAQSAYVQQDDLFIGFLTVKEHLIFQSLVRMDAKLTYKERLQRVEEVMGELSLKKCENVPIGEPGVVKGISGGERKRLALAAELLTNPSLLFCDEPTSGLDSFMSLNVVQMLKAMAQTGRTVICTLHQPSSELFQMFDKIGLMAEGRTAFLGTPAEADKFFTKLQAPCPVNFNPADYYIQILSIIPGREDSCKHAVKSICDAFETSSVGIKIKKATAATKASAAIEDPWSQRMQLLSPYKVSWIAQFRAVSWRCWLAIKKNPRLTRVKFYQVFFVSVLISILFWNQKYDQVGVQNINGALFLFLTNATFLNLMGVILTFCSELPLFLREHKNGMYRTDVYFLAKIAADIPIYTLINMMGTTICYFSIGLNDEFIRYGTCVVTCVLVTLAVMGAGYIISTISSSIQMAQTLVSFIVTPFLIFGGMFLSITSVPPYLQWLADLSWFKYGNQALLINQWSNVGHIICDDSSFCPKNGLIVLASQGISPDQLVPSLIALVVLAILFRILSFFALLYKAYYYE
ncbi:protein white-like isoform X1 [Harmonia axyridis]|uniref:protein white-like isoform X1 n=1 Tax=Harmonia axyridis TaxID=115357 RepID=UPI001E2762CC|nr:protein white-like isoform X1 [Harmonia axyridis]XP_045473418.1 protein white-like isoform X1 [Harmonia axyridis]